MEDVLRRGRRVSIICICTIAACAAAIAGPALATTGSSGGMSPAPAPTPTATRSVTPKPTPALPGPTDGWQTQASGTAADLGAVDFADADHGWAVGIDGGILTTSDGGDSWQPQASAVTTELRGVALADTTHGWAVGGATLLATSDGGAHWTAQGTAGAFNLRAVTAVDTAQAWAVGDAGGASRVLATSDGGATWHLQGSGSAQPLNDIVFPDELHGWAVGGQGTIVATTDGGATWQTQTSSSTAELTSVSFCDATHGWAAGTTGSGPNGRRAMLLATDDGGATWTDQYLPAGVQSCFADVVRADALHGWAVGQYDGITNAVMTTADGGASWDLQAITARHLDAVAASDAQHAWVVGSAGAVMATADGGASSDVTPPVSSLVGTGSGWRRAWYLRLGADDGVGGSGVTCRQFSFGRLGRWQRAATMRIDGSPNHALDGTRIVYYRAADGAGNVEATRQTTVRVDTRPPTVRSRREVTVARGDAGAVPYTVLDKSPCAGWVNVTLRVYSLVPGQELRKIKTVKLGRVAVNTAHTARFSCPFPRGVTYFYGVKAVDAAGNKAYGQIGLLHLD